MGLILLNLVWKSGFLNAVHVLQNLDVEYLYEAPLAMGEENLESARFELLREVMEEEWRAAGTVKGR